MSLYGVFKAPGIAHAVFKTTVVLAAVIVAMDPTVKVALITCIGLLLSNLIVGVFGLLNQREMKFNVDGNFKRMLDASEAQSVQLADKSEKLAHAEGHREGIEQAQQEPPK